MKTLKIVFGILFLICLAKMSMAQDVIVMKDQSTVLSKVLEITNAEIKYKKWSNLDGPTYSINRSEVACINFENGDVEKIQETRNQDSPTIQRNTHSPQVQYPYYGKMEKFGASINLNGRKLTNGEIRGLVGEQNYQYYFQGKQIVNTGQALLVLGSLTLTVSYYYTKSKNSNLTVKNMKPLWWGLGICGVTTTLGTILCIKGGKNIDQVVNEYNNCHGVYSLNLSPSLMRCDMAQSQGNCGLGLTLSINF